MSDRDDLEEYLDQLSEKVWRNATVVTPEEVGQDYMLHISIDTNIKQFTPVIGLRQGHTEDRTVPRICVAPSLLACMAGHAQTQDFFLNWTPGDQAQYGGKYKGGFKIYALPFKACLKPNARLVYDAPHTDEHWLVAYNKDTASYTPKAAGKVFYRVIQYVARKDKQPEAECVLFVEVTQEEGLWFNKSQKLSKGYWVIEGPVPDQITFKTSPARMEKDYRIKEVSRNEYLEAKNASAVMLSHQDQLPSYLKWIKS